MGIFGSKKPDSNDSSYTCKMHPEVHMDSPGKCPKCNMKLQLGTGKNNRVDLGHRGCC